MVKNGRLALANNFQSRGKDAGAANLNIVNCSLNHLTGLPELEKIKELLSSCQFDHIQVTRFLPGSEYYGITASAA